MSRRTLALQNQMRSTTSGIEYDDILNLSHAEFIINEGPLGDPLGVSGTIIMDMNYLRTAIRDIKGSPSEVNWFDGAVDNATFTTLSGTRGSLNSLQTFLGWTTDLDTSPDYDTLGGPAPFFINSGDAINVAIEKLDEAIVTVSGLSSTGEIAKQRHIRGTGQFPADTTLDLSDLIGGLPGWTSEGDEITWDDATDFVENVSIFVNGVLQLSGVNVGANRDVYFIASPDQLAFGYVVRNNDIIQIWKSPPS